MIHAVQKELPFCMFCMVHHEPCSEAVQSFKEFQKGFPNAKLSLNEWSKAWRNDMHIPPKYGEVSTYNLMDC